MAFKKIELRYEKVQKFYHRILGLNQVQDNDAGYQEAVDTASNSHMQRIDNWGQLRIAMVTNPNHHGAGGIGEGRNLRPVEALRPSLSLTFDHSPTELTTWLSQFKSYFEASRLHTLPLDQQQAFLRQGLAPDVWTVSKQRINIETKFFNNPLEPDEESC